jgi:hypothetical protein
MSVKKEEYPLERVCVNLREGDWEWLKQMHGRIAAGKVVRELVMKHRRKTEAIAEQKNPSTHLNLNLEGVLV